jgi:hypothetical protein
VSFVLWVTAVGMIEIEEALREATMSPDEIVMRFKKPSAER